jgi:hypothetical protein
MDEQNSGHLSPSNNGTYVPGGRDVIEDLSTRAGYPITLDGLVEAWSDFVRRVENGYEDSIYEYVNDLSMRELINEVSSRLPPAEQLRLQNVVDPLDARFKQATRRVSKVTAHTLLANLSPQGRRIPNVLTEELREDLIAEGILG